LRKVNQYRLYKFYIDLHVHKLQAEKRELKHYNKNELSLHHAAIPDCWHIFSLLRPFQQQKTEIFYIPM